MNTLIANITLLQAFLQKNTMPAYDAKQPLQSNLDY